MNKKNQVEIFFIIMACLAVFISSFAAGNIGYAATDSSVPGTTEAGGIVQCGRGGQEMCTLCDLIKGLNIIIHYLLKIAIVVALTAITVGGGMYVISTGNSKMIDMAKGAMKNAVIGLVIMLSAWLLINTLLLALGASSNLGITGVTVWGNFDCAASN